MREPCHRKLTFPRAYDACLLCPPQLTVAPLRRTGPESGSLTTGHQQHCDFALRDECKSAVAPRCFLISRCDGQIRHVEERRDAGGGGVVRS